MWYINFIKNARGQAVPAGYSVFLSCFCMFSHDSFILHSVTGMPALSESVFVPAKPREHFEFMEEDVQVWIFEFGRVTGRSLKKIEIISKLHLWLVELWGLSLQYISATHLYQVIAFFSLFFFTVSPRKSQFLHTRHFNWCLTRLIWGFDIASSYKQFVLLLFSKLIRHTTFQS